MTNRARSEVAFLALPAVALAVLGWTNRVLTDDGFIFFRVVQQILAGHGPVFNKGQRVEAFTSPLWVFVLTIAGAVTPFRLEWIAVVLGIVGTGAGLAFATFGAARLNRPTDSTATLVPVGALVPLAVAPVWYFATTGLETGLVFFWEGLAMWSLARWARSDRRPPAATAVLVGLGWLIRPDLLVFSLAMLVAMLVAQWPTDRWRDRVRFVGLAAALPLLYQIFRMGYYGALVPNTAIAKEATLSRWGQGWTYLRAMLDAYWLWIPLLALLVGAYTPLVRRFRRDGANRHLAVVVAFAAGAVLQALYVVRVGGDYFPARLLLPALFGVCLPVAALPVTRRHAFALAVAPWALICALALQPAGGFGPASEKQITVADRGWGRGDAARAWYSGPGVYYAYTRIDVTPPADLHLPTDALWGIGLPAYAIGTRLDVLDLFGLADPLTARLELHKRGFVGHEKQLPSPWVAARLTAAGTPTPDADFPSSPLIPAMIPLTHGSAFRAQVVWARAALECPHLRELRQTYTAPLTLGRFFSNITRSFRLTRLRIPPDPEQAYHRFCGPGVPPPG